MMFVAGWVVVSIVVVLASARLAAILLTLRGVPPKERAKILNALAKVSWRWW